MGCDRDRLAPPVPSPRASSSRCGAATLLVERHSFPRAKVCGGCLNGGALVIAPRFTAFGPMRLSAAHAAPVDQFLRRACEGTVCRSGLAGGRRHRSCRVRRRTGAPRRSPAAPNFFPRPRSPLPPTSRPMPPGTLFRSATRDQEILHATSRVVLAADGLGHASVRHIPAF